MEESIIKTVDYVIEPDGNCRKCECNTYISSMNICLAFDLARIDNGFGSLDQCPACVEFIIREKSKIKCSRCEHVRRLSDLGLYDRKRCRKFHRL